MIASERRCVVLMTGAAPYLGGASTWEPLREQFAAGVDFRVYDMLDLARVRDLDEAARTAAQFIRGARAVVAHHSAAALALAVASRESRYVPLLLLSPLVVVRRTFALNVLRAAVAMPAGRSVLRRYATGKKRRLERDRRYVRRQLEFFARADAITDALVDEAQMRLLEPRAELLARRAPELLLASSEVIDARAYRILCASHIIVGAEPRTLRALSLLPVTRLSNVRRAPMLEAPHAVAAALRLLLASSGGK